MLSHINRKLDDELADFIDQYKVIILLTRLAPS